VSERFFDCLVGIVAGVLGIALLTASAVRLHAPVIQTRSVGFSPAPSATQATIARRSVGISVKTRVLLAKAVPTLQPNVHATVPTTPRRAASNRPEPSAPLVGYRETPPVVRVPLHVPNHRAIAPIAILAAATRLYPRSAVNPNATPEPPIGYDPSTNVMPIESATPPPAFPATDLPGIVEPKRRR